jgi:bifunctional DNA-binding transcriptional regulator/antitoxin component of YhaV-PrlF toxin-antitoxin module
MKLARVTAGGQISLPASVRRRWGTARVAIVDEGDRVVVTPVPDDPIAAVRGSLSGRVGPAEALRGAARRDEDASTRRRA